MHETSLLSGFTGALSASIYVVLLYALMLSGAILAVVLSAALMHGKILDGRRVGGSSYLLSRRRGCILRNIVDRIPCWILDVNKHAVALGVGLSYQLSSLLVAIIAGAVPCVHWVGSGLKRFPMSKRAPHP